MSFEVSFEQRTFENKPQSTAELQLIANYIRQDIIKSLLLAKSGHSGGPLGITDFMTCLYFNGVMKHNPSNWQWKDRDRFVLSAGHMAPVLYSVLARAGYFPCDELASLRKYGSRLQGHPGLDVHLPGIETSSGSLGQGVSIALGMAMNDYLLDKNGKAVYCITGDGELQEGACWEAAMAIGSYKLSNFCWIVDNNDCQIDGRVKDIMSVYPLKEKFESFGFNVIEIDGHNYDEINSSLGSFKVNQSNNDKPTCIIAKTYMGKGVSFMHDQYKWHGNPPNQEQAEVALSEIIGEGK
jgi:transketolase